MNRDFNYEFMVMEEWARKVEAKFGQKVFTLRAKREHVIEDSILCMTFDVETELPSGEVTQAIVEEGRNYKKGRRYFFIYDGDKKMLFLQFYPYYILNNEVSR